MASLGPNVWDIQWENCRVVWKNVTKGGPKGNQSNYPKDLSCEIFRGKPEPFQLIVRILDSKTEKDAAEGLSEKKTEGGFGLSLGTV